MRGASKPYWCAASQLPTSPVGWFVAMLRICTHVVGSLNVFLPTLRQLTLPSTVTLCLPASHVGADAAETPPLRASWVLPVESTMICPWKTPALVFQLDP